jgi:hypothetical protein
MALILDESSVSGQDSCLDARAKLALFSLNQERFVGDSRNRLPDGISGLITGEFPIGDYPVHGNSEIGNMNSRPLLLDRYGLTLNGYSSDNVLDSMFDQ